MIIRSNEVYSNALTAKSATTANSGNFFYII